MLNFLKRLFQQPTVEDLIDDVAKGRRSSVSAEELNAALERQKAALPKDRPIPKKGEVYEALESFEVTYMTSHHAPYTGGGKTAFPVGERFTISQDTQHGISVYCDPVNYDALHEQIVPEDERNDPTYAGYYFSIDVDMINKHCKKVVA